MTEKTKHQVSRFLDKVVEKYPFAENPEIFTDIHIHASRETGDLMAFDDDGKEITRCVVEEWINNQEDREQFYQGVESLMQSILSSMTLNLGIIKPYSFILETGSGKHIAELYVVDDSETVILGSSFMEDMEKDLNDFIEKLLKE